MYTIASLTYQQGILVSETRDLPKGQGIARAAAKGKYTEAGTALALPENNPSSCVHEPHARTGAESHDK